VHDCRRRSPPCDAHAPRTPTVAAAAGNKETPLLAADVPMCADVVFVVTGSNIAFAGADKSFNTLTQSYFISFLAHVP